MIACDQCEYHEAKIDEYESTANEQAAAEAREHYKRHLEREHVVDLGTDYSE